MSMSDPIADMLSRIRNGQQARKGSITLPASKVKKNILNVLKTEGYIRDYSVTQNDKGFDEITVELKYHDGEPVIKNLNRVSKPGRRVYASLDKLPKYYNGLGVYIVSTSQGVMSDYQARESKIGGELICNVY